MKYFSAITVYAFILSPLAHADVLRKTRVQDSVESSAISIENDTLRTCQLTNDPEECDSLGSCSWIDGRCEYKIVRGCGMILEGNTCESMDNCVWMPKSNYATARPGENMICANKSDVTESIVDPAPVDLLLIEPPDMRTCQEANNQEVCDSLGSCGWFDGRCEFIVRETCGFVGDKDMCTTFPDCVWMYDENDSRPNALNNRCVDKVDVVANGNCLLEGLVIRSQSACNSVKGCSWNTQDEFLESCRVAPTQLQCANIKGKSSCRQAGCFKKRKFCVGRWETKFLSTLKKLKGTVAKLKIEEEYGEGKFDVVFVPQGVKQSRRDKKKRDDTRIKLFLNKRGKVKKAPKFG